ncbi:MAG: glycosyltransferase family 4 protein [Alphaproteobacteria bacterium]|jgi:UDP-N-acetylmuramyl pentapeptide phosphotransferase/UDP-N-acetylglucosamine-1-phosphate transferase|nr:glycosyltransferase family 4 protein [Alphaproteobacteria bacterium]
MSWSLHIGLGLGACFVTYLATGVVLRLLHARAILDHPNDRSSHSRAVPRGGGLAVMAVVVAGWCALAWLAPSKAGDSFNIIAIALLAAGLAGFSFLDDIRGLPAWQRLALQALAVLLGCLVLPESPVFQGLLPPVADRLAAAFCWLWFVNLFNFMDGIDGISAVEAGSIGIGIALIANFSGGAADLAPPAVMLAGAAVGFGILNWHPAKIFLGDVGSVGLGFLLGWLLLSLAAAGQWVPALLLGLYYLCDATWTLLRRMLRGEPFWRAHRSHFYQHAAHSHGSHGRIALLILGCNIVLVAASLWAALGHNEMAALILGGIAVAFLLCYFATMKPQDRIE